MRPFSRIVENCRSWLGCRAKVVKKASQCRLKKANKGAVFELILRRTTTQLFPELLLDIQLLMTFFFIADVKKTLIRSSFLEPGTCKDILSSEKEQRHETFLPFCTFRSYRLFCVV